MMAIAIGVLMAIIILLAVAISFIVIRHKQRKCFASPLASKATIPGGTGAGQHLHDKTYHMNDMDEYHHESSRCGNSSSNMSTLPVPLIKKVKNQTDYLMDEKLDDYQEPYQALRYAPYYSYSSVVMEMQDMGIKDHDACMSGLCSNLLIILMYLH